MTCRTERGVTYLQTYNAENRIASIQKLASGACAAPGTLTAKWDFTYDGDGVRTGQSYTPYTNGAPGTAVITRYYFGGALEIQGSSVKKYYSFAGQMVAMREGTALQYFLTDHLSSILAVTDSSGTLINQQRYLPFGEVRTDLGTISQTDFGYTSQRKLDDDMGGIMDYKARFYSPYINRFLQPDSIVPDPASSQSWNRYAYVKNNPLRFTDPTGHREESGYMGNHNRMNCKDAPRYCNENGKPKTPEQLLAMRNSQKRPTPLVQAGVFHTSFQMIQMTTPFFYSQVAEEGFTDYPGGGDSKYLPQVYGVSNNSVIQPGAVNGANAFALGIDFLRSIQPSVLRWASPFDQQVALMYENTYQNIPSANTTTMVTLNSIQIHNGSSINQAIHYTVVVDAGNHTVVSQAGAGPGETANVALPGGLNVYNGFGGLGIKMIAFTGCPSICFVDPNNSINYAGSASFNFNP